MPKLNDSDIRNFETLSKAFATGNVALLDVKRRSDGKSVAAIVAVGREGTDYTFTPFAIMVEGNPFELFDPPSQAGDGYYHDEALT